MSHAFQPMNDLPSYCRCGKHREAMEHRTDLEGVRHAEAEETVNRSSGQLRRENAGLYSRVRELEGEIHQLKKQIADLKAEVILQRTVAANLRGL